MRPRPFLLSMANRMPSRLPSLPLEARIPVGQRLRINFILVNYPRVVVLGAQTSPDLSFVLSSARGKEYMGVLPVPAVNTTTPSGGRMFRKSQWVGLTFDPSEVVKLEIFGFAAGPSPSTVSVALLCQLDWGYAQ